MILENVHRASRTESRGRLRGRDFFRGRFADALWFTYAWTDLPSCATTRGSKSCKTCCAEASDEQLGAASAEGTSSPAASMRKGPRKQRSNELAKSPCRVSGKFRDCHRREFWTFFLTLPEFRIFRMQKGRRAPSEKHIWRGPLKSVCKQGMVLKQTLQFKQNHVH